MSTLYTVDAARVIAQGLDKGLCCVAKALSYGKCAHQWEDPETLCTFQVQKCSKCGKVRRI